MCVCVFVLFLGGSEVDIPSSALDEAAAATDAELRRLPSKSLADRLAQLIPVPRLDGRDANTMKQFHHVARTQLN